MFWLLAAISAVLALAAWRLIPETLPVEERHAGGLRQTGRAFVALARDRVFVGYALTVAFAYASLFGYISGSSFALQDVYGLTADAVQPGVRGQRRRDDRARVAQRAAGAAVPGAPPARGRARRLDRRRGAAAGAPVLPARSLVAVLAPLFVVVATRGLVSSNATVLGVQQAPAAGSASAILGALMFAGGVLVTPLMALGGEGTAVPMVAVVAGGAIAALLATALLTLRR